MSSGRKKRDKQPARGSEAESPKAEAGEEHPIKTSGWTEKLAEAIWKEFPVPGARESLRVNFAADAYAELICHAKEDLSSEVCGVLAGQVCEDEEGHHVAVQAVVRGASTRAGVSHVTYTQETWNRIHETMEQNHPKLQIVGWYHSHPGFGVEFSDMDLFIHENFFSGRGQIAFVTDPLGGEEAICIKTSRGVEHLERFWVAGRERRCKLPASSSDGLSAKRDGAHDAKNLQAIEDRLAQTLQAVEDLRTSYYRFLTFIGMIVALGVIFWIGNIVYTGWSRDYKPPETKAFLPGPVKVGGQWRWIGATLVTKELAPEVEAKMKELDRAQYEAAQAAEQKQQRNSASGDGVQPQPASQPSSQETSQP